MTGYKNPVNVAPNAGTVQLHPGFRTSYKDQVYMLPICNNPTIRFPKPEPYYPADVASGREDVQPIGLPYMGKSPCRSPSPSSTILLFRVTPMATRCAL